jgi:hypothetical protein
VPNRRELRNSLEAAADLRLELVVPQAGDCSRRQAVRLGVRPDEHRVRQLVERRAILLEVDAEPDRRRQIPRGGIPRITVVHAIHETGHGFLCHRTLETCHLQQIARMSAGPPAAPSRRINP